MVEPRSLPELVAARATGGLAEEEFFDGLTFGDLASPDAVPPWMRFLHDPGPWAVGCERGIALFEPLNLIIAARSVARALALHEQDRVCVSGDLDTPRLRLAGVAATLYAGAVLTLEDASGATVRINRESVTVEAGEPRRFVGWCETCGLGALTDRPGELGTLLERTEAEVREGELLVRGPLVMAGYKDDPEATAAAFAGGWFHTGQPARAVEGGQILLG